jgi:hypothetical protein
LVPVHDRRDGRGPIRLGQQPHRCGDDDAIAARLYHAVRPELAQDLGDDLANSETAPRIAQGGNT